jgi:hypothetical protein
MARNATNTLAGLIKLNDQNMSDIYPTEVLDDAPVMAQAFAQPASQGGTLHQYLRRAVAAGSGFRKLGRGISNAAEEFDDISVVCELLDASYTRDVGKALAHRKGVSAYLERETLSELKSGFFKLETALFNIGLAHSYKGLPYFPDYWAKDLPQVVDAGGSGGKSVWLLRWAEDGVSMIAGNDGRVDMRIPDEDQIVEVRDADNRPYSAYRGTLLGWFALQVGSSFDAVRICNLDGTSGKTLTGDMLGNALSLFPAARQPNMIVMNRKALEEFRSSRTAYSPIGADAQRPNEYEGIPIVTTDALVNNEATLPDSTQTSPTSVTTSTT